MDRLLSASKELSDKIDSNESAANELLHQCEVLQQNVKAMIQYQSAVQEITGGEGHPRGPPRIEFGYIRQLQQDNAELRTLLEEHQATLDMVMGKYREQIGSFIENKTKEDVLIQDKLAEEVRSRTDQVCEMATVMYDAARAEDVTSNQLQQRIAQLEYENKYLREIMSFSTPVTGKDQLKTTTTASSNIEETHSKGSNDIR